MYHFKTATFLKKEGQFNETKGRKGDIPYGHHC